MRPLIIYTSLGDPKRLEKKKPGSGLEPLTQHFHYAQPSTVSTDYQGDCLWWENNTID